MDGNAQGQTSEEHANAITALRSGKLVPKRGDENSEVHPARSNNQQNFYRADQLPDPRIDRPVRSNILIPPPIDQLALKPIDHQPQSDQAVQQTDRSDSSKNNLNTAPSP